MTVVDFQKLLEGLPKDLPLYICDAEEGFCEVESLTSTTLYARQVRPEGPTVIVSQVLDGETPTHSFPAAVIGFGKMIESEVPE